MINLREMYFFFVIVNIGLNSISVIFLFTRGKIKEITCNNTVLLMPTHLLKEFILVMILAPFPI